MARPVTHATTGRITVEPGANSITLYLHMWGVKPDAVLALPEAEALVDRLQAAIAKVKGKATSEPDEDDFSDLV